MKKPTPGAVNTIPDNLISAQPHNQEVDLSRVIIIGPRASGKSTFSSKLAGSLNLAHIEFDTINRKKDGSPPTDSDYQSALTELVQQPRWIVDGDYLEGIDRLALPIVWPLASALIWLDLPFLVTMRRLVTRSRRRVIHKEEMWGGMQDKASSLLKRVASGNAVRAYWSAKRAYPALFKRAEYSHLTFLHPTTQVEVDQLLSSLIEGASPGESKNSQA